MMSDRLFSLCTPAPQGFTVCSEFNTLDFRRASFALYASSQQAARDFLGRYLPRLAGIILLPGESYSCQEIAPRLSEIIVPAALLTSLADFAIHQLTQLNLYMASEERCSFLSLENKRFELNNRRASEEFSSFRAGLLREIEERRETERQLIESEQKFRKDKALLRCLIDSVGDLIFIKDTKGVYLTCNKAAEDFLGIPESEQIGKTDFDFFDHEIAQAIRDYDRQLLAFGKEDRREEWATYRDGRRRLFETIKAPYYGSDGEQLGLVGIARDITERKAEAEALRESEELFHTLCDSAPIGIFKTDSQGNTTYRSPGLESITGLSAREGIGLHWTEGIHPEDLDGHGKIWNAAVASGNTYAHEHRRLTAYGKTVWVRTLVSPLKGQDGKVSGYVGTIDEVSELRKARQDMERNQKIESLGALAGGIAHDFNNILTIILGNISMARLQRDSSEKVTEQLKNAENATVRARDLAQQLLTFAKGGEPIKKDLDLRHILKESADFALHGSNVKCEYSLADDLWPVEADEGQICQVIQNLVLNAVQAMPGGGTVTIGAGNVVSVENGENQVKISVADTGTGISESHIQKIFDPYFTTKPKGSGLGLSICYSIIAKHGGGIKAKSKPMGGTTFHFTLPASEHVNIPDPRPQKPVSRGNGRILVMDDEKSIRDLLSTMLENLGYEVESVEEGKEAVALYTKRKNQGLPFSAVILDLTIPGGMGGKEAMAKLRSIDREAKVIVSSGYSNDPVMANFRDFGFSAVLTKPYRFSDINQVLQDLPAK